MNLNSLNMEEVKEPVPTTSKEVPLEISLKQRLNKTLRWEAYESFTLSRVPTIVRESHKDLYEPRVVSIGPYHRGKESLGVMEEHKARCLIDFLDRNSKVGVEVYIQKVRELEDRARRCYTETINLNHDEFVEMLLLDGCFILEFFFRVRAKEPHILLDVGWGIKTTLSDLLLFENQIPFFVIETLYAVVTYNEGDRDSLLDLLEPYSISPDLPAGNKIFHLLHLYYQWFIPGRISKSSGSISFPSPRSSTFSESSQCKPIPSWLRTSSLSKSNGKPYKIPMRSIPCATELHDAGVTFRKKKSPCDVFDITFENGIIEIPTFLIDSVRRVFYMNLAAFEQSSSAMEHDLTSYVALMNALIKTNKDVVLLKRRGIINNMLLNDEELAVFFNQFGAWSTLYSDKHYFSPLFAEVQSYYESRWHKYRAKLMHDYFNNPWSVLSVIAAIVLLIFAAIQAVGVIFPGIHD
ncbi:hypothetical protein LUZ62_083344 [Rhynchospora pubera]|uniref:Uncharacterized protein n=1 Tax=Rhynchospora pubera TaxID=906938 RepID=A0AAV8C1A0_9POAL|nr:hypothetical protein LUZ62_083344 [Rhynchospora pubera]